MFVRALVQEGTRAQGVLVPQQGLSRDAKGDGTVLVVGKDDKVAARTVHVSRTVGDQWLVEDGLAAGDRVIVEGAQKVEVGATVVASERGDGARLAASR
jgi:membrane fusion protein (multidrug efflux system)